MTHIIHRAGRALLGLVLTAILLSAPAAWASPGANPGGWLSLVWTQLTAWISSSERGASVDPSGFEAISDQDAKATTETDPWTVVPLDPATTDASGEDDDRGPGMDPDG